MLPMYVLHYLYVCVSLHFLFQDVILSFNARQQGSFKVRQKLDVIGSVICQRGDNTAADIIGLQFRSFHTITLHLSAVCRSETTYPEPKLNPGKLGEALHSFKWNAHNKHMYCKLNKNIVIAKY